MPNNSPSPIYPCICGHRESMHRRAIGGCRGRRCACPAFLNDEHLQFLVGALANMEKEVELARKRMRVYAEAKAPRAPFGFQCFAAEVEPGYIVCVPASSFSVRGNHFDARKKWREVVNVEHPPAFDDASVAMVELVFSDGSEVQLPGATKIQGRRNP